MSVALWALMVAACLGMIAVLVFPSGAFRRALVVPDKSFWPRFGGFARPDQCGPRNLAPRCRVAWGRSDIRDPGSHPLPVLPQFLDLRSAPRTSDFAARREAAGEPVRCRRGANAGSRGIAPRGRLGYQAQRREGGSVAASTRPFFASAAATRSAECRGTFTVTITRRPGSGSIVNDVQLLDNDFGQLVADYQEHAGAVNIAMSLNVGYTYADGMRRYDSPHGRRLSQWPRDRLQLSGRQRRRVQSHHGDPRWR